MGLLFLWLVNDDERIFLGNDGVSVNAGERGSAEVKGSAMGIESHVEEIAIFAEKETSKQSDLASENGSDVGKENEKESGKRSENENETPWLLFSSTY